MIFIIAPHPFQLIRNNSKKKIRQFKEVRKSFNSLYRKRRETNNKSVAKNRARKKEEKKAKEVRSQ